MASYDLPSDQQFLETLMRSSASPHLSGMRDLLVKQAYDAIDEQIEKVIIDERDRETYLKIQLDSIDPVRTFQNDAVHSVKSRALDCLGTEGKSLDQVPVGALSVVEMNAFAIRTPRGGAAVALNGSLWPFLKIADYCILAIMYRETAGAIGAHHSDETYALNLLTLVDAIRDGAILVMVTDGENSIADCVGPAARPDRFVAWTIIIQLTFILLHEYGHIFHGHLDTNLTRQAVVEGEDIDVYLTSHWQEFEADEFAIRRLLLSTHEEAVRHHYITALIVLFLLFDMCENIGDSRILGTHPKSRDRLKRIHEVCRTVCGEDSWSRFRGSADYAGHIFESLKEYGL